MGLTLTQAFQIHAVVGILFCLPVFSSGISGFLETITNGQLTDPDMFTLHLAGVDFSKNIMIALQCYAGTKMNEAAAVLGPRETAEAESGQWRALGEFDLRRKRLGRLDPRRHRRGRGMCSSPAQAPLASLRLRGRSPNRSCLADCAAARDA